MTPNPPPLDFQQCHVTCLRSSPSAEIAIDPKFLVQLIAVNFYNSRYSLVNKWVAVDNSKTIGSKLLPLLLHRVAGWNFLRFTIFQFHPDTLVVAVVGSDLLDLEFGFQKAYAWLFGSLHR